MADDLQKRIIRFELLISTETDLTAEIGVLELAQADLNGQLVEIGDQIDTAANVAVADTVKQLRTATIAKASAEAEVAQLAANALNAAGNETLVAENDAD